MHDLNEEDHTPPHHVPVEGLESFSFTMSKYTVLLHGTAFAF